MLSLDLTGVLGADQGNNDAAFSIPYLFPILMVASYVLFLVWAYYATAILPEKLNILQRFSAYWDLLILIHFLQLIAAAALIIFDQTSLLEQHAWLPLLSVSLLYFTIICGGVRLFLLFNKTVQVKYKLLLVLAIMIWPLGIWWMQPQLTKLWRSCDKHELKDHLID